MIATEQKQVGGPVPPFTSGTERAVKKLERRRKKLPQGTATLEEQRRHLRNLEDW